MRRSCRYPDSWHSAVYTNVIKVDRLCRTVMPNGCTEWLCMSLQSGMQSAVRGDKQGWSPAALHLDFTCIASTFVSLFIHSKAFPLCVPAPQSEPSPTTGTFLQPPFFGGNPEQVLVERGKTDGRQEVEDRQRRAEAEQVHCSTK